MLSAMKAWVHALLPLFVVGVAACGSDSPVAPTPTTPTTPADTLMPTLSSIQSLVFTPRCVMHHGPDEAEAGLDLSVGLSFANLVNVPSTQVALDRVTPNDAENSYLIHKLDGPRGHSGRPHARGRSIPHRRRDRRHQGVDKRRRAEQLTLSVQRWGGHSEAT